MQSTEYLLGKACGILEFITMQDEKLEGVQIDAICDFLQSVEKQQKEF